MAWCCPSETGRLKIDEPKIYAEIGQSKTKQKKDDLAIVKDQHDNNIYIDIYGVLILKNFTFLFSTIESLCYNKIALLFSFRVKKQNLTDSSHTVLSF